MAEERREQRDQPAYNVLKTWAFDDWGLYGRGDELLARGNGSKPHRVESCYRSGGESVHVCHRYPNGVSAAHHQRILSKDPEARTWNWRVMRRNPDVYVRGRIRHPDHKTLTLHGWHRVLMNTENQARAMRNVAFLD